jgi:hypothetical protein
MNRNSNAALHPGLLMGLCPACPLMRLIPVGDLCDDDNSGGCFTSATSSADNSNECYAGDTCETDSADARVAGDTCGCDVSGTCTPVVIRRSSVET